MQSLPPPGERVRGRRSAGQRRALPLLLALASALAPAALLPPALGAATAPPQPVPAGLGLSLLTLEMEGCRVRYSPGSLDRAAHVQEWLCELAEGGRRLRTPRRLAALVVAREEWERAHIGCRYGMPCELADDSVALPAAGDPTTIELWSAALGGLPAMEGSPLLGTAEEAASLAPADALAIAMVAHRQVRAAGFAAEEPWLLEVLGHLFFIDSTRKVGRGTALAAFWGRVRRRAAEADPLTGELAGEMARQARLFAAAEAIAGSYRRMPVRQLRKLQSRGGGVLRLSDLQATWPQAFHMLP